MRESQDSQAFLEGLRRDLRTALTSRQPETISTLRTLIASVDNAGASRPESESTRPDGGIIARSSPGVFSTEVPRRELTMTEVRAIIRALICDCEVQGAHYRSFGHHEAADRLRREAGILRTYLWR